MDHGECRGLVSTWGLYRRHLSLLCPLGSRNFARHRFGFLWLRDGGLVAIGTLGGSPRQRAFVYSTAETFDRLLKCDPSNAIISWRKAQRIRRNP